MLVSWDLLRATSKWDTRETDHGDYFSRISIMILLSAPIQVEEDAWNGRYSIVYMTPEHAMDMR